jgi:DNA polymerase II small subunit/DNA polymerase delta subunit B
LPSHHQSRSKKSLVERQVEWDDVDARDFRHKFKSRVEELSQVWKKEYAAKQAQKGKDGDKQESSDSDVDIVEDTAQSAKSASLKPTKAARIRG